MNGAEGNPHKVLDRLLAAVNNHDLDALVGCFADDYVNETPAHPQRGFHGNEQVRRNWTQIFAGVPDIRAVVRRRAVEGNTVWSEWEMSGARSDGAAFEMRGVVIFDVSAETIASARFYLEPVEEASGDVDAAVTRVAGTAAGVGGEGTS